MRRPGGQLCARASVPRILGQGVEQLAVRRVRGGKQIYLCGPEAPEDQLDHLGMESPFSR